ncbi:MAG: hypothetical protein ACK5Q5_00995 [Planctomycetaceae bacterium]
MVSVQGGRLALCCAVVCFSVVGAGPVAGRDRSSGRSGGNWGGAPQNAGQFRDSRATFGRNSPPAPQAAYGRQPARGPGYGYQPQTAANYRPYSNGPVYNQPQYPVQQWRPQTYNVPAVNNYQRNTNTQAAMTSRAGSPATTTLSPSHIAPKPTPTVQRTPTVRESAATLLMAQTREAVWNAYDHYTDSPGYADIYRDFHRFMLSVNSITEQTAASSGKTDQQLRTDLQEAEVSLEVLTVQTTAWKRDADAADGAELKSQLTAMKQTLSQLMTASDVDMQDFAALADEPATPIRARQ